MSVRKGIKVSESKLAMQSLQHYDKYSNPAVDYRTITKEILEKSLDSSRSQRSYY